MPHAPVRLRAWLALLLLAVVIYFFGLGGAYIPTNGDEMVYAHIARLTAASGHWLPLASELDQMRNTKPPLLFWQAMVAGGWGEHWQLWTLRLPSVVYTLLTSAAIGWSVLRITHNRHSALVAAIVYLGFFCTFRYGRPFLTSAPETFWLSVPMFFLLWHRLDPTCTTPAASYRLGWLTHIGFGVAFGLGLAYKSFALIAPASAAFWCALLLSEPGLGWRAVLQASLKTALSVLIALGLFGLWFVLDPDPAAVWQEFVVGENVGKLSNQDGYWKLALSLSGGSAWAQLLAYVQNAGLLSFVVLGLVWAGVQTLRQRTSAGRWPAHLWILLVWVGVWLLVFTLPSQRSARYVIPAMPALEMLIALSWERIARGWFLSSMGLSGLLLLVLARIGAAMHELAIASDAAWGAVLLVAMLGFGALVLGFAKPAWTRFCTLLTCLSVLGLFSTVVEPLSGSPGRYPASAAAGLQQARVAVPNGFNGQFERFQFVLPGPRFVPYDSEARALGKLAPGQSPTSAQAQLAHLLRTFDAVVWVQSSLTELEPPCMPGCTVLGSRWEVKGRHQSGDITLENLWYPQQWLFRREWLVQRVGAPSVLLPIL